MTLLGDSSVHDQGKNETVGNKPSISNAYSWDLSIVEGRDATAGGDEGVATCGGEEGGYEGRGEPQVHGLHGGLEEGWGCHVSEGRTGACSPRHANMPAPNHAYG